MLNLDYEYPDFEKFDEYIHAQNNLNFLDKDKFLNLLKYCSTNINTCESLLDDDLCFLYGDVNYYNNEDKLRNTMISYGVPEKLFVSFKNKSGYSMDKEVLNSVVEYIEEQSEITPYLLSVYLYISDRLQKQSMSSVISSVTKGIQKGLICKTDYKGWDGTELFEMYNIYRPMVTGRRYAREMGIVGLPLVIRQCIVSLANRFIAYCDARQIDMNVAYNIYLRGYYPEEDEIFDNEPEDKYLAMYKIVCLKTKTTLDLDFFMENRDDMKTIILAGLYGAGIKTLRAKLTDFGFAKSLREYYDSHEGYISVSSNIRNLYDLDIPFSVKDYFGFEMEISVKNEYGEQKDFEKVMRDSLSYTVQSTSNSIIVKWTNSVKEEYIKRGCTEDDVFICMLRHDEVDMMQSNNALKNIDILANAQYISIPGWNPLKMKIKFFIHYDDTNYTYEEEEKTVSMITNKFNEECAKIDESSVCKQGTFKRINTIPLIHDLYIYAVKSPRKLYEEISAYISNQEFDTVEEEDAFFAEEVDKYMSLASPDSDNSYSELYDIFVLRNSDSGKKYRYKGLRSLNSVLTNLGIRFLKVHTIRGSGFEQIGDCQCICESLNKSGVFYELYQK